MAEEKKAKKKCCRKYQKKNEYCKRCPIALKTVCIEKTKRIKKADKKKKLKKKRKKKNK